MKVTKEILSNVILPLLVGVIIYVAFRSQSIRMFDWFDRIKINSVIYWLRNMIHPFKKNIPKWFYFSLHDGLWVYSFSSAYFLIWRESFKVALIWVIIPITSGCLVELAQLLKLFPGTFDIMDFVMALSGVTLSIIKFKKRKYEKNFF